MVSNSVLILGLLVRLVFMRGVVMMTIVTVVKLIASTAAAWCNDVDDYTMANRSSTC